jgi:imidazolonepropionase-like amidohydrolase
LLLVLMLLAAISCHQAGNDRADSEPSRALLLKDFDVVPMTSGDPLVLKSTSVLIRNGVIDAVGPSASIDVPNDADVIEGKGRILMPGLIDMHVHVWDEAELIAYLEHGVTTVRNASGMPFHLDLKELIASGEVLGPRLVTTGPILNSPGPNEQVNHQLVETAEEARQAVRMQYEQGYRRLKVYSNLTRETYESIVEEARSLGMTIMGHTPEGIRESGIPNKKPFNIDFLDVIDDGFVTIEHMESIVWHGLADSLDEDKARELARSIARAGVTVDPTLLAHRNLVEVARSDGEFLARDGVETLNPFITEFEHEAFQFWSSQPRDARQEYDDFYLQAVKIFHEEGVMLVAGTDSGIFTNVPGRSLLRELELYSDAGLNPYEILKTTTVNAANTLGTDELLGQVAKGYVADLIIVDGSPLDRVSNLRNIMGVISNGRWFDVSDLQQHWAEVAETSYERTQQRVLDGLSEQGVTLE